MKYSTHSLTTDQLSSEVDDIITELRSDSASADLLAQASKSQNPKSSDLFTFERDSAGLDPLSTAIIVGVASSATKVVCEKLWHDFILPNLRRRLGQDVLEDDTDE